jgi:hypothetical protein
MSEGDDAEENDDPEFLSQVSTLLDVDVAMEEAALCLQHAESYTIDSSITWSKK